MKTHDCNCGGHPSLPPAPGSVMWMPKQDDRPQLGWWAPGEYLNLCRRCNEYFIGDKRAGICADCAYSPNGPAHRSAPGVTADRNKTEGKPNE